MARKFSPITSLTKFYAELDVSSATGKKIEKSDPDFPRDEIVQVGANRRAITERGKEKYLAVLALRAKEPRAISPNLSDPRGAAAKSVAVRRAKASARRSEQGAS
ncbi:MAG TPA: hypothetical protein VLQ46_10485 [Casimicrobiaceae bacterium]|nr:hypothetical protein [Casimicrobiaceae bacterium]